MNQNHLFVLLPATLLLLGIAVLPHAGAAEIPVAVEPPNLPPGYDWASRINQTHLIVDATPLYALVDATDVVTPYIDLEIKGLMPWRAYDLTLGPIRRAVYANGAGHGVAWNVFAEPGVWTLVDRVSGEPVNVITIAAEAKQDLSIPLAYCPYCWYSFQQQPPQPYFSDAPEEGKVVEQGLYSFTPDAIVEATTCWSHAISVEAKASGGDAAISGTAGGTYTHEAIECDTMSSQGQPRTFSRGHMFRKDWYDDGSWKIYSVGESGVGDSLVSDVYWPPNETRGEVRNVDPPSPYPYTIKRTEKNGLGVRFGGGVKVYGVGLDVVVATTDESSAELKISFVPAERAAFRYWFVAGKAAQESGLIAMVWRLD